ncbi:MAG: hypothetical protein K0S00_1856 [Xanthobacteraceae bacterium]|jgi:hypothetical protein|nr:hypothetical protein [Xanthobacteraceae bacterium]
MTRKGTIMARSPRRPAEQDDQTPPDAAAESGREAAAQTGLEALKARRERERLRERLRSKFH